MYNREPAIFDDKVASLLLSSGAVLFEFEWFELLLLFELRSSH